MVGRGTNLSSDKLARVKHPEFGNVPCSCSCSLFLFLFLSLFLVINLYQVPPPVPVHYPALLFPFLFLAMFLSFQLKVIGKVVFVFFIIAAKLFLSNLFNITSSIAPRTPLYQRMVGLNPGLCRVQQTELLTTKLNNRLSTQNSRLIHTRLRLIHD